MVKGKPGPEGSSGTVFGNQAYLQSLSNLSRQGLLADSFLSHKSTNHKTHTKPTLNYTLKNAKGDPGSPALQADALPSEPPGKPLSIGNFIQVSPPHLNHFSHEFLIISILLCTHG